MDHPVSEERRAFPRVHYAGGVLPPGARVHPGREVIVVDLSRGGALVEGVWRFRPGASVTLQVQHGPNVLQVRGDVERSFVHAIERGGGLRYRAAIRFDSALAVDPPGDALFGTR